MGAWGYGPFENDDASDWLYELEDDLAGHALREAFEVSNQEYLEAPEGAIAVAAAEVVAAAQGRPAGGLPAIATAWIDAHKEVVTQEYTASALAAVHRVLDENSELRDLWSEAGEDEWIVGLEDLRRRLQEGRRS